MRDFVRGPWYQKIAEKPFKGMHFLAFSPCLQLVFFVTVS